MSHNLGIELFKKLIATNLLRLDKGHRLQHVEIWNTNLNGNDTTLIMSHINQLWTLVLVPNNLNDKFWKVMEDLPMENKVHFCKQLPESLQKKGS